MNITAQLFGSDRLTQIGDAVALRWDSGSCTFQQLADNIQSASSELRSRGVGLGQRVVFQCADSADFVAWYFGALNIGAVAVAVSTRLDAGELNFVVQDSEAQAIVFDSTTVPKVQAIGGDGSQVLKINLDGVPLKPQSSAQLETVARGEEDEAFWVYSSGSTSRPKGIVHTHRRVCGCCHFHLNTLQLTVGDLIFCSSKLSFAYALANGLLAPLQIGATIYLHSAWITLDAFRSIIERERPKVVFAVPSVYRGLLSRERICDADLLAIPEFYVSAGEHLPSDLFARWQSLCNRTIINAYGCSETVFLAFAGDARTTPPDSVGRSLPGVEFNLMNSSNSAAVAQGEEGILHLMHPFTFSRYANRPADTMARLSNGRFNTGDMFRQDEKGNWHHLGREDDLIKVASQWVYLREIERFARDLPIALDVAVVSAKDDSGSARPALFFVPESEMSDDEAVGSMRGHLEKELPMFKRPSWIRAIGDLPRTANGKLSRSELQQIVEGQRRDQW